MTSKSRLRKNECAFYHEKRHRKKDCHRLKKKDKNNSIFDACVIKRGGDSSDYELCLVGHQTIVCFDEWVLVMGCTYHMCPHKKRFFKFEEVDRGAVYIGNSEC